VQQGQLHDFSQFHNDLLRPTDVRVRHVGFLLHGHHRDRRVDFRGQGDVDEVLGAIDTDAHALLDVRGRDCCLGKKEKFGVFRRWGRRQ
jgi:hypothetical protein